MGIRTAPEVGKKAPDFKLESSEGGFVKLSELRGKYVALYFYPKDSTPGCTREACDFRDNLARLKRLGVAVLGVSCDSMAAHRRFAENQGLNFPLLSDPGAEVCKAFGVYKKKSLYGRTFLGIERSTFLLDDKGTLFAVFRKVRVEGHVDAVVEAIRNHRKGSA